MLILNEASYLWPELEVGGIWFSATDLHSEARDYAARGGTLTPSGASVPIQLFWLSSPACWPMPGPWPGTAGLHRAISSPPARQRDWTYTGSVCWLEKRKHQGKEDTVRGASVLLLSRSFRRVPGLNLAFCGTELLLTGTTMFWTETISFEKEAISPESCTSSDSSPPHPVPRARLSSHSTLVRMFQR